MQIKPKLSSHSRARSPEKHNPYQPPLKRLRRRTWCDIVESRALANGIEDDAHRVAQRQKQIDYGKNTIAYDRFNALCPRESRNRGDPMTPLARQRCSKRSFAGQITSWKKHVYAFVAKMDEQDKANELDQNHTLDTGIHIDAPEVSGKQIDSGEQRQHQSSNPHHGEEEELSDMDDIELDDFGNVVADTSPPTAKDHHNDQANSSDVSPASIFDAF